LSYPNFYRDVGAKPSWRHLLIRDDVNGAFAPGNAPGASRGINGGDRPALDTSEHSDGFPLARMQAR
jgi:hypothetical protein